MRIISYTTGSFNAKIDVDSNNNGGVYLYIKDEDGELTYGKEGTLSTLIVNSSDVQNLVNNIMKQAGLDV